MLSPRRGAVAGGVCSALFFLSWVYFAARTLGWSVPKPLVAIAYVALYVSWWRGPTLYCFHIWTEGNPYPAAWFCALILNALTMAVSILMMTTPIFDKINPFRRPNRNDGPMRDTLPNPVYLLPFALLWGWTAVLIALTVLSANADG